MCKVMAMAGIKPENRKAAWDFAKEARKEMSLQDRDGAGYAAMTTARTIFAEKWLHNPDAFDVRTVPSEEELNTVAALEGALMPIKKPYKAFGTLDFDNACAIILHTRLATCQVSIENTHPFISDDGMTALIHNGVIYNTKDLVNKTSTCDSECILNSYLDCGTNFEPTNIQSTAEEIQGGYACAVLGIDGDGVSYLDVFRNDRNPLVMAKIKELGGLVFCTNTSILEGAARTLRYTIEFTYVVMPGYLLRFNAETGALMSKTEFNYETADTGGSGGGSHVSDFRQRGGYRAASTARMGTSDDDITEEQIRDLLMRDPHYVGQCT